MTLSCNKTICKSVYILQLSKQWSVSLCSSKFGPTVCNFLQVMTLLEIWRQVREDTDVTLSRPSRLPEPPHVRERLVKEIKFFVDSLQKRSGALPSTITSSRVVEYVNLSSTSSVPEQGRGESSVSRRSGGSRPDSAVSSWDGRDTPLRSGSSSGRQGR